MATAQELLAEIDANPDLCDLGYRYAEFDRRGHCLWVIDCAQHLWPIAQRHLSEAELADLDEVLECGRQFLDGHVGIRSVNDSIAIPRRVANSYCETHGEIPYQLAETLEAIADALELTLPDSRVYHEDVIYAAARAAFGGQLHDNDSADTLGLSDCNSAEELAGTEQSDKETKWQLDALRRRLLNNGT